MSGNQQRTVRTILRPFAALQRLFANNLFVEKTQTTGISLSPANCRKALLLPAQLFVRMMSAKPFAKPVLAQFVKGHRLRLHQDLAPTYCLLKEPVALLAVLDERKGSGDKILLNCRHLVITGNRLLC